MIRDQRLEASKRPRTRVVVRCRGHGCIWRCVNPLDSRCTLFQCTRSFLSVDNTVYHPARVRRILTRTYPVVSPSIFLSTTAHGQSKVHRGSLVLRDDRFVVRTVSSTTRVLLFGDKNPLISARSSPAAAGFSVALPRT